MKMKSIYKYLLVCFTSICLFSCNSDWIDEQYEQYISFKAPMDVNGCTSIYVRYKEDGKYTYNLPIIVSGSTLNEKTRHVHIAEDLDTLQVLNEQRFGLERKEWWYEAMEKGKYYDIPDMIEIPKGESVKLLNIDFSLEGIDMSRKWVVPLTIVDDPSFDYQKHPRKNYAKAILRVWPFNDFSGAYSTTSMEVYFRDPDTDNTTGAAMVTDKRTAYVVDENTVFFYAGLMNEELDIEDRQKYKIFVRFLGKDSENPADKKLQVWAESDEIKFDLKTNPDELLYTTASIQDAVLPYLEHRYVMFNIEYNFDDVTSEKTDNGANPIHYKVKGSLTLERNINTQIPDEDQAIQW